MQIGPPRAVERLDRGIDHRGVQIGARGVTRTSGMHRPVDAAERPDDGRSVVQIDHDRRGAAVGDALA